MKSNQKIYSINAIVIIIDIFTKLLVATKLKENDLISIIPNFFSIYYVKNTIKIEHICNINIFIP